MYCVVMIEPGEELSIESQINEVFGPFATEQEATDWTTKMQSLYKSTRRWLIMPMASSTVVNKLDPQVN